MLGTRLADVTASARSLPLSMCGPATTVVSNIMSTWPAITSWIAGALPLYGMCVMSMPAFAFSSSSDRCCEVPLPADADVSGFFALPAAITSCSVLYGLAWLTTRTVGLVPISVIGRNDATGS